MVRIGALAFLPDHFHDVVNFFLPVDHLDIARLDDIVSGALIKLAQSCIGSVVFSFDFDPPGFAIQL